MVINETIAIILGYLLGSIPSAYLVTRLVKGKDIRQLGGGNVGGLNVFREVGPWAALVVGIVDLSKGAAAAAIAHWLLDLSPTFVMLAGLASVIGHNWMVWLKFSGGKGMGATFGALLVLMPLYGYWQGLLIFFGIILIPFIITRNVALSMGTGVILLPLVVWLGTKSLTATYIAIALLVIIVVKFLPTALAALAKSKTTGEFIFDRWQRGKKKEE
ncbi:glycerol-3-phosphate acyltransferase [Chloroflexota bacterium]